MSKAFRKLSDKFGAGYGRIRLNWHCQCYDVLSCWDECPEQMMDDIEKETAPQQRARFSL